MATITCAQFLARYSEYRDGLVTDECERLRFLQHLASCDRCQTYDSHVSRGVMVLRSTGEIEPSRAFGDHLARRIAEECGEAEPITPGRAGIMAGLMLAAAAALLFLDAARPTPEPVAATPATAPWLRSNASPTPSDLSSLVIPAFGGEWRSPGAAEEPFIMMTAAHTR